MISPGKPSECESQMHNRVLLPSLALQRNKEGQGLVWLSLSSGSHNTESLKWCVCVHAVQVCETTQGGRAVDPKITMNQEWFHDGKMTSEQNSPLNFFFLLTFDLLKISELFSNKHTFKACLLTVLVHPNMVVW